MWRVDTWNQNHTTKRLSFASQEMADLGVKKFGVIQVYPMLSLKVFDPILHYQLDSTHYKKFQSNRYQTG